MLLLWLVLLAAAPSLVANIDDSTFECRKRFEDYDAEKGWLNSSQLIHGARDDCFWTIQQEGAYSVQLELVGLNVTASPNCSTDYLEVLDGESVLMRVCGTEPPQNSTVISQSNTLTVHLKSSSFHHSNSFNASYTKKCGATIYATETGLYHHQFLEYNCTWTVLARHPNQRILVDIHFQDMSTDGKYLDTWGVNSTTDQKRLQMSLERRHVFLSLGEAVHFSMGKFLEDEDLENIWVHATYTSGNHACGRSLSMDMSQEHDSSRYGHTDRCVWNIDDISTVGYGPAHSVQFTLQNLNVSRTPNCSTDYLEVLDGPSPDGEVLKRVCGNELNTTVTSPSDTMTVRLKMNNIDHNNSYIATYAKVCRTPVYVTRDRLFWHSGSNCSWTLVAKEGQHIWLSLHLIAEGSRENETSSYVDVWDGMDNTGESLLRLFGNDSLIYNIKSHGPAVHISLVLIPSLSRKLWVEYQLRDYSCGFKLVALPTSSSFDSSEYDLTENCAWSIPSFSISAVQLTLKDLNIAETPNCSADYLEVIDDDGLGGKVATRVCGSNLKGKTTFTSQGTLTVRLKSSSTHHNNSFRLTYKEVCAAARTTSSRDEIIHSLSENCTWTLKAKSSQEGILITDIRWRRDRGWIPDTTVRNKECENVTFVDIRKEVGSTWQYVGRYCEGRSMRSPIRSDAGAALRASLATPPNGTFAFFAMRYCALKGLDSPRQTDTWTVPVACIFAVIAAAGMAYIYARVRREKRRSRTLFENGNIDNILPFDSFVEQAKYLPYDNIFEVRNAQLRMGKVIGMGVFGVVRKAEAYDIVPEEPVTTVAVKMLHGNRKNQATMDALAAELKIMVHLGRHLNIVNLLGAHTPDLKNIFLVLEYCKYGNLQNYLSEHRSDFAEAMCINTGVVEAAQDDHNNAELNCRTSDLFLFAFQVAQGMEFLTSRNVWTRNMLCSVLFQMKTWLQ